MLALSALGIETLVVEGVFTELGEGQRLEEAGGDDAVGVDVVAAHHDCAPLNPPDTEIRHVVVLRAQVSARASLTRPSSAAAVAIEGDMSKVRPRGLPWRPMKFRLLVLAQI